MAPATNLLDDFLRPIRLKKPYALHPISAQWGEQAQLRIAAQFVLFGAVEVPLFQVDVSLGDAEAGKPIPIVLQTESQRSECILKIEDGLPGGYRYEHVSGPTLKFKVNKADPIDLIEYLRKDPFIVRYVDGSSSYNCYHIPVELDAGDFDVARLESWEWGVPLNKESMGKAGDRNTIQYRTFEKIRDDYDFIFNDDGSGEAADLVCFKDVDEKTIRLTLVHCKGAVDGRVSRRIENFYYVCGQAQKSIGAKHGGMKRLADNLRRRQETWAREGKTRFLKGDYKTLQFFTEKARRAKLEFEMILVQPGGSASDINPDALKLLATTEVYLFKTTNADFRVILSP